MMKQKNPRRRVEITSVEQTGHCVARHPRFCHRRNPLRQGSSKPLLSASNSRSHPPASPNTPRGNQTTVLRSHTGFIHKTIREYVVWFKQLVENKEYLLSIFYCYQQVIERTRCNKGTARKKNGKRIFIKYRLRFDFNYYMHLLQGLEKFNYYKKIKCVHISFQWITFNGYHCYRILKTTCHKACFMDKFVQSVILLISITLTELIPSKLYNSLDLIWYY